MILVLGGTGFIGRALIQALRARGYPVRALARTPRAATRLREWGVEPIPGDVTCLGDLQEAVSGVRWIFHCVGVRVWEAWKPAVIRRTYLDGGMNLIRACRTQSQLEALVYLSGMLVFGRAPGEVVDEETPPEPDTPVGAYQWQVEQALLEAHRDWGLPVMILRPGAYYGPGGTFRLFYYQFLRRGWFRLIREHQHHLLPQCAREDVVEALLRLAERRPLGKTYVLAHEDTPTHRQLVDFIADRLGVRPPGTIPYWLARMVMGPMARMDAVSRRFRIRRIRNDLDFSLHYPNWQAGVEATLSALQKEHKR